MLSTHLYAFIHSITVIIHNVNKVCNGCVCVEIVFRVKDHQDRHSLVINGILTILLNNDV